MRLRNKWLLGVLVVAPSVVAVASLAITGGIYQRVRAFDVKHQCDVLAGLSSAELKECQPKTFQPKTSEASRTVAEKKVADMPVTNAAEKVTLAVERIEYDGDCRASIVFNARPDLDVIGSYVTADPPVSGKLGFRYEARYDRQRWEYVPVVHVTGEYAFRTNVTLRVMKGLALLGHGTDPSAEGSLTEDFTTVLRRRDPKPSVTFGDSGRYLPTGGCKALRIEAVGVTNIATSISRVEARNIVQLLAREEGEYSYRRSFGGSSTADDGETAELAGECETGMVRCVNRPCETETCLLPVAMRDGGHACGVYLVSIRNGDRPADEIEWRNPNYNPTRYRLVCLSDLGLSVRRGKRGLGVWVASLTTGLPVGEARVEVYSSANILIAEGDTDGKGWCEPRRLAKGEPFAVVVWTDSDMTFLALRDSMQVDETYAEGSRPAYLEPTQVDAFAWTERGIYRHGERIFLHAIVRDGARKAPQPMPITLKLRNPKRNVLATKTLMTDEDGALSYDGFAAADEQPSGLWTLQVCLPGLDGAVLAEREIRIEEFAPPQIRVNVRAGEAQHPTNFTFSIAAEHLFGGPARALPCEGAVVFEDVPFAPRRWKGFTFGNDQLGLKPSFRRLSRRTLDDNGACVCEAPLWADSGRPKAAVRATGQGVVFEDGGRPATARKSIVCHYYPYYIGSSLPGWLKLPETGAVRIDFVCVDARGELVAGARRLVAKIERIDSVYSYRKQDDGMSTWDCERIRTTVFDRLTIPVDTTGRAAYALPLKESGDYVLTVEDPETGATFGRTFYLSDWGDDVVRAPLGDPTEVTVLPDKAFYRVGDRPRLVVKAPFTGYALMSVLRDGVVYDEIFNLTNATSEIVLRPVERDWAPNVDVSVSVVQSVAASARHLAARAHGMTTVRVRPVENELEVRLSATVRVASGKVKGAAPAQVSVDVTASGATSAVVTLVDEGINLLTGEPVPNPVAWLSRERTGDHPLYDLYGRILPVVDDGLRASGVKTGGGFGAEMLGRVSPVPTRRFKPLAMWQSKVGLKDGRGRAVFELPEFVGEVRVTAVACSATATGSASVRKKVTPKLVMQPDAPRFVAPEDEFDVTLTLRNCGDRTDQVAFGLQPSGMRGRITLAKDESTNVVVRLKASKTAGEMKIDFFAEGTSERHEATLSVPVRPATAWHGKTEVVRLEPGKRLTLTAAGRSPRFGLSVGASPMVELASALNWLADYPYGCLEQTTSRIFPLVTAGGILNSVAAGTVTNRSAYVAAGVRRVESMIREHDFVMWPDCTTAPWDREVSLYAAHFLIEAERSGQALGASSKDRVLKFLKKWALSAKDDESAYACHTLALAGQAEKDRMLRLYDARERLNALSRARLARAFAAIRDRTRAEALMVYAFEPQSVKEAAFNVLALVDLDPNDARIPKLVDFLTANRDKRRFSWGTTAENAHALLAIGAYCQHHPVQEGTVQVAASWNRLWPDGSWKSGESVLGKRESLRADTGTLMVANRGQATAFLTIREQWLNDPLSETNETAGLSLSRRFWRSDGTPADLGNLVRGEMLIAELTITSDVSRVIGDLVVEDLFAGAFEPVHSELDPGALPSASGRARVCDWVLRKEARDDRMLVFSTKFELKKDHEAKVFYPVRVVSAGDFILPGPSVEGMYHPALRARCAPGRLVVRP